MCGLFFFWVKWSQDIPRLNSVADPPGNVPKDKAMAKTSTWDVRPKARAPGDKTQPIWLVEKKKNETYSKSMVNSCWSNVVSGWLMLFHVDLCCFMVIAADHWVSYGLVTLVYHINMLFLQLLRNWSKRSAKPSNDCMGPFTNRVPGWPNCPTQFSHIR